MGRKAKRGLAAFSALVFCALALAGCAFPWSDNQNVEDLLTAPQTDSGVAEMRTVVEQTLGVEIQLKYPRGGDNLSPFLTADLDGDGRREAVLFYTVPAVGTGVQLAVLKGDGEGGYSLAWQGDGTGTDIAAVFTASMGPAHSCCLVVGYTNINISDKYAAVYRYTEQGMETAYGQAYSQMTRCDMTGDGWDNVLFASSSTKPGAVVISMVAAQEDALTVTGELTLAEGLYNCTLLQSGTRSGRTIAVADCAYYADVQAGAAFCWRGGALMPCPAYTPPAPAQSEGTGEGDEDPDADAPPPPADDVLFARATMRPAGRFTTADLDGDGALEVPGGGDAFPGDETGRFLAVTWYRPGAGDTVRVGLSVADADYGFVLLLPQALAGTARVQTGFEGSWSLVDEAGTVLLEVVLVPMGDGRIPNEAAYTQVAAVAGNRVLLKEGTLPDNVIKGTLAGGFQVLE